MAQNLNKLRADMRRFGQFLQSIPQRTDPTPPGDIESAIWIHACSVGEANAARVFLQRLVEDYPDRSVILSVSTQQAYDSLKNSDARPYLAWSPAGIVPGVKRKTFERFKPSVLIFTESDVWPGLVKYARAHNVPTCVISARIGDRTFRRMSPLRNTPVNPYPHLDLVAAQNEDHATRYVAMGTPEDRVIVAGNLKFSAAPARDVRDRPSVPKQMMGGDPGPIIVFGSTSETEEQLAIDVFRTLKTDHPKLRLVIALRHIERGGDVAKLIGSGFVRRSEYDESSGAISEDIVLVDRMGELIEWYAIADAAVVCGSFVPDRGGQNPIEPAALGIPTLFGPYTQNFRYECGVLCEKGAAVRATGSSDLAAALDAILRDDARREAMSASGRAYVDSNRNAVCETMRAIDGFLERD